MPIRIRVALVFVTALAIAFGLGGWLFYTRLSASLLGVSLEDSSRTLGSATHGLLIGGAAFLILAGIGAYWLARAALAPVERMRRQAAALSDEDAGSILQVPRTHDEIAALAATMNDLLVRLRAALARQRAFAADASHELRTPIAVLAGELELANRPGRSRAELAAAVAIAGEEVTRLARITDDLLVLARGDEDKLVIEPELTDIRVLLARSTERASSRAAAAGLVCRVEAPAGLVARADPVRIGQAVDNLVGNALRFAPRGTDIVLSGERSGCWLVLEVRDRGPGFPPDFLPHAFERFRRPERDRARGEGGAGLGLAIVRAIVLAHGGRVAARNRSAGGAAVQLEIPAGN